jgi:NodT family efflux transporter outer membrane factor (OMF) lipoprotein
MRKALLLSFAALYGCAATPAYRPSPVRTPAEFRETLPLAQPVGVPSALASGTEAKVADSPAETAAEYWQQVGDTTLTRLVGEALRSNLNLRAAQARIQNARANRSRALLEFTPSATVGASYARQRLSTSTFPGGSGVFPDQGVWDAGFDASWELDVFGRLMRSAEAQGALVQVAEEDLRDAHLVLAAELARAYFELRGAQERLDVARRNSENQRNTLDLTRQRLDAGRGTAFDTERAQAQLSSTLASIPAREAQVSAAQYRIGVLVGRSPAQVAAELTTASALPVLPVVPVLGSPDSIVRYRPDVAAAERRAAAQTALVRAARADYLPRLTLSGQAGYTASEFNALGNDGTFRYGVGPVVTWAGLNLGRVKANVRANQAREEEAEAQYTQTVLLALEEVETATARFSAARLTVDRLEEASAASERAAELARLRFTEGVTDFLQVLDAERTQLESQDQLAQSRADAAIAYAALYKAVGGRWAGR